MAEYDTNELNVEAGLEYSMDSEEFYIEILQAYLEESAEGLTQMGQYLAEANMVEYATLVHALKSSSRLIGAANLGEEAYALELKSKEGDVEFVRNRHDHLKQHTEKVFEAIRGYLADKQ